MWRDVTITLTAFCKAKREGADPERCDDSVSVLEVLPNATNSGQKESVPAQIASAISGLGTAAAPFFPASTLNEKVAAAGDGLTVLFRNLFPPQTQTYFHAFLGDERTFGWNYREDTVDGKNPSLLGLNRGVVLLKAPKSLVKLMVHCDIMSKWSDDLGGQNNDPYNRFSQDWEYDLPAEKSSAVDYESLPNLDTFPALIHIGELLDILHLVDAADYNYLIDQACHLVRGKTLNTVTKASVKLYVKRLGYNDDHVEAIVGGYEAEISKDDIVKLVCRVDSSHCPARRKIDDLKLENVNDYFKRSAVERYLGIEKKGKDERHEATAGRSQ